MIVHFSAFKQTHCLSQLFCSHVYHNTTKSEESDLLLCSISCVHVSNLLHPFAEIIDMYSYLLLFVKLLIILFIVEASNIQISLTGLLSIGTGVRE